MLDPQFNRLGAVTLVLSLVGNAFFVAELGKPAADAITSFPSEECAGGQIICLDAATRDVLLSVVLQDKKTIAAVEKEASLATAFDDEMFSLLVDPPSKPPSAPPGAPAPKLPPAAPSPPPGFCNCGCTGPSQCGDSCTACDCVGCAPAPSPPPPPPRKCNCACGWPNQCGPTCQHCDGCDRSHCPANTPGVGAAENGWVDIAPPGVGLLVDPATLTHPGE